MDSCLVAVEVRAKSVAALFHSSSSLIRQSSYPEFPSRFSPPPSLSLQKHPAPGCTPRDRPPRSSPESHADEQMPPAPTCRPVRDAKRRERTLDQAHPHRKKYTHAPAA